MLNKKNSWIRKVLCLLGVHEWNRAVRTLGNDGTKTCKHCGTKTHVRMRPRPTTLTGR